jgi:hypothetical protein
MIKFPFLVVGLNLHVVNLRSSRSSSLAVLLVVPVALFTMRLVDISINFCHSDRLPGVGRAEKQISLCKPPTPSFWNFVSKVSSSTST